MGDLVGVSWVEEEAGVRSGLSCGPTSKAQPPRSKAPRPQRLGCHSSWASHQAFYYSAICISASSGVASTVSSRRWRSTRQRRGTLGSTSATQTTSTQLTCAHSGLTTTSLSPRLLYPLATNLSTWLLELNFF